MKLIVESGSTKSRWVLLDGRNVVDEQLLPGINPTGNPNSLRHINDYILPKDRKIDNIYFYGAGVSNPQAIDALGSQLENHFGDIQIEMQHDILAAARSVSDGEASITSILGTGTNTVVFDGVKVVDSRKALGYLMADFGSGCHIGKILIWKYYNHLMDENDAMLFRQEYISEDMDFIYSLYQSDRPNFQIASMSRFLDMCSPLLKASVLSEAFSTFIEKQINTFTDHQKLPLHFVGSISSVFRNELETVVTNSGFKMGRVSGNPMDGLIAYHTKS